MTQILTADILITQLSNLPHTSVILQMHTRYSYHTASSCSLQEPGYSSVNVQLLLYLYVEQPVKIMKIKKSNKQVTCLV